ncbi:DUF3995 domain-containing protein [Streptomyces pactum]|uniref:DUF3995 domain-containing protein n=1 Tax=Streptomyces pactum TaxID=68249 RepID=A0ABS0NTM7_9ACTN|nr:DUF3995 domain-containing protein [Streptomyces pactum]MBH5338540.1 DUF3995 domain-containing protein [Streptomyces pactum]
MTRRLTRRWPDTWAGHAACGWAVLFGLAHIYAGFGGARVIIEHSVGKERASGDSFVMVGLFGTGALCLAAAALALALTRPWGRVLPRWMPIVAGWTAAAVLIIHSLGAFVILTLAGADVIELRTEAVRTFGFTETVLWNVFVFEPPFLLGGTLFALATRAFTKRSAASPAPG